MFRAFGRLATASVGIVPVRTAIRAAIRAAIRTAIRTAIRAAIQDAACFAIDISAVIGQQQVSFRRIIRIPHIGFLA
jgi:hypothetical protein